MSSSPRIVFRCFLFIVILSFAKSAARADDSVKIGAVFAFSGIAAGYGNWLRDGAQLGAAEINRQGGIDGKPLSIIFEDSAGAAEKGISAYQKLVKTEHIGYVLTTISSVALAIAPLANREKVVQMDVGSSSPAYSSADDYTFRTGIIASQLAEDASRVLRDVFKIERIAHLYIENQYGEGMRAMFAKSFTGQVAPVLPFRPEETDYRPQLLRLKQTGVSALWLTAHVTQAGLILKQAKEIGLTLKVFSDVYSIESNEFLAEAGSAAEGVVYFAPRFDTDDQSPAVAGFVTEYRQAFHEDPTYYSAQTYDGVLALGYAMQQCKALEPRCVKDKLYSVKFDGASGRIEFDRNGDVRKETMIKTVSGGKFLRRR